MKLKNIPFLSVAILFFFAFTTTIQAQVIPKFGVKGGVNFATFAQSDIDDYTIKPGVLIGAFAQLNVPLSPISIQPELLYAQYGTSAEDIDADITINYDITVNYIQVPVLLKLTLGAPGGVSPNIFVGPYVGFMLSSELSVDGASLGIEEIGLDIKEIVLDIEEAVIESDFGLVIGAGIDTKTLELALRVTAGAPNVFEDGVFEDTEEDGEKNLGIALTLGIKF